MQTETLIRASAQVARITELHAGDVYKRLDTSGYAGSEATVIFGIVTDVMSNGEDAAFTATEITKNYMGASVRELKTFTMSHNIAIFPATPEEIQQRFAEIREEMQRKVVEAQKAFDKARDDARQVDSTLAWVERQNVTLRAPSHELQPPGWTPAQAVPAAPAPGPDASAIGV